MIKERYTKRIKLGTETNAPYGVGAFLPSNILIIGEKSANPESSANQQPFCDYKGCSGWLNNQLEDAGIPEEKLFWVNAINNDGSSIDLNKLVDDLNPSIVIALGGVAAKLCHQSKVDHHKFYHPQYWKRFGRKQPYEFTTILRDLCAKKETI